MPAKRSPGYRAKKQVAEQVACLREQLAQCHTGQWQRANHIMECIAELTGHSLGPSNGKIVPRACRHCKYYGHTRTNCPVLRVHEEREMNEMLAEDEALRRREKVSRPPYDPHETEQARFFRSRGIPYVIDPYVGALIA